MVIGVKFKASGKIYYFDALDEEYKINEKVIVETARGLEYGTVYYPNRETNQQDHTFQLKPIIRKATPADDAIYKNNLEKEKVAFKIFKEKIIAFNLNMKLIDVEYTFDNQKLLFYFTAEQRVDFRELVKDLATIFKTRIELRQIGVRDETKHCGGIGICGRNLCCNSFLNDFHTVSIKMAKDQNLSLNPVKISGICGRLMCCLEYENETYIQIKNQLPEISDIVLTPNGEGEVLSVNVLREQVKVSIPNEKDIKEAFIFKLEDIKLKGTCAKCPCPVHKKLDEQNNSANSEKPNYADEHQSKTDDKNTRS
ncbi:MAG: stage 0 sporulation protein [Candidatus Epulonipiscioides saccharophilum]|nr:MAG: stage 0 sporulation protein [Epulopiscium sp. AS2M-Bin001]